MNRIFAQFVIASTSIFLSLSVLANASPWLPVPQTLSISVSRVYQESTQFFRGDDRVNLPFGRFDQTTTWISATYGLNDKTAIDFQLGSSELDAGALGTNNGMVDTSIGVTRSILDEIETGEYSLAIRAVGTIAGDYDTGRPHSLGDGADSLSGSVLLGKFLTDRLAIGSECGVRVSNNEVPMEFFINTGINFLPNAHVGLYGIHELKQSSGDTDIGQAGFSPAAFPEVQENYHRLKVGMNVNFKNSTVDINYYNMISGRNTADFNITSVQLTYYFDLFGL